MAGNKVMGSVLQFRPVEVSQQLQNGEKFVKWDEVWVIREISLKGYGII